MKMVVTVFGSSRPTEGGAEYAAAFELGKELGLRGYDLCNGGYGGTMEASARGARESHAAAIGVTCDYFSRKPNRWIDKEVRVPTFADRLLKLVELGDAYAILPGGTGTLLELASVWEFTNKGLLRKKPVVVVGKFWQRVAETMAEELRSEGLDDMAGLVHQEESPAAAAAYLHRRLLSGL